MHTATELDKMDLTCNEGVILNSTDNYAYFITYF